MSEPLTPEYEAEIREHVATMSNYSLGNLFARDLLAEIDRLRAELAATQRAKQENDERFQLEAAAQRERAEKAEFELSSAIRHRDYWHSELQHADARIAELERPAVEAKRNEIRQSYAELVATCEETKDYEGAFDVQCRLRDREAQWAGEDAAKGGA